MEIEDLKLIDPQTPVTLRFGKVVETEEGDETREEVDWSEESWIKMRILVSESDSDKGEWFMTPISMDGRPYSLMLVGHNHSEEAKGHFRSPDGLYAMEVREMREGSLLRDGYESGNLEEFLVEEEIDPSDLSPLGQVFFEAVTSYDEDEVPTTLLDTMLNYL